MGKPWTIRLGKSLITKRTRTKFPFRRFAHASGNFSTMQVHQLSNPSLYYMVAVFIANSSRISTGSTTEGRSLSPSVLPAQPSLADARPAESRLFCFGIFSDS